MTAPTVTDTRSLVVNGAFRPQRVTGQQRYAIEIADRLVRDHGFGEHAPQGGWLGSAVKEWAWTMLRLPSLASGSVVVSLTARSPFARRQVLVVHDLFVLTNPEWFSRKYVLTHAPTLRAQLRTASAVVAVSEPTAEAVRGRFAGKVVVAPNAPSDVFRSSPSAADAAATGALESRGLREDGYLLTVGSKDPRKNLPRLAHAYGLLPEETRSRFPLVVVGGGAAIYQGESIAWPKGTVDAGYVTDDDLRALYAGARAVVFPSMAEGFGLPLVEAAAAGAGSLVVSDLDVFRWICEDGAVYVDPSSAESIAAGLTAAIEGRAPAISIDLDRFDWNASARAVAEICTEVARNR
ncbi:glycosyltransferase family 4 protein [Demequina salsinemoris]|uniref:glycosyltransferase family 4 protein n=1 Tax=Demequina salsinemoris TaxID=577470 RepID=UPI00078552F4|nr:glycosyltransferase family 1 protein [Demequina salsinemoris]